MSVTLMRGQLQGHGPLPKTFSIPMGEPRKEKKEKRAKEKKSKRKRSKHSPERGSSQAVGATGVHIPTLLIQEWEAWH